MKHLDPIFGITTQTGHLTVIEERIAQAFANLVLNTFSPGSLRNIVREVFIQR